MGGARRDEEKARAKERFFHIEMNLVNGTPKSKTRTMNLFNGRKNMVNTLEFSNFKLDRNGCMNIKLEKIKLPSLYFSHQSV